MTEVNMPNIPAIVEMKNRHVRSAGLELYENKDGFIDPEKLVEFVRTYEAFCLIPIHDEANPLIKDERGTKTLYLMWGRSGQDEETGKQHLLNSPEYWIAMACPLTQDSQGNDMYKPAVMYRGSHANVIVVGGMSCCGAVAQTHWTHKTEDGYVDEPRLPAIGILNREHANWLVGKVHAVDDQRGMGVLAHIAMDLLAHRLPDDPRFKHNCRAKADVASYTAQTVQTLALS